MAVVFGGGGGVGGKRHIDTRPHTKVHVQGKRVGDPGSLNEQQQEEEKNRWKQNRMSC